MGRKGLKGMIGKGCACVPICGCLCVNAVELFILTQGEGRPWGEGDMGGKLVIVL